MATSANSTNYTALTVRPGPNQVLFEQGAYSVLPEWLNQIDASKILLLHRDLGYAAALPFLPDLGEFDVHKYYFGGECTRIAVADIAAYITANEIDAIVAIGGGKILDTAKGAAVHSGNTPVFLLPTLASNCAPYSTISVYYTDGHEPDGFNIYALQPAGLLVEPRVIQTAPVDTFIAGIGDTLAKWYECVGGFVGEHSNSVSVAKYAAQLCRDIPLGYGAEAIADHRAGRVTTRWQQVVEAIIITAGLVGGFGGAAGRATAAHAVSNGLVVHRDTTHVLHGTQVAYGILVQLALEHRDAELAELVAAYPGLELPLSLRQLGVTSPGEPDYQIIAQAATEPTTTLHALENVDISDAAVASAVGAVEAAFTQLTGELTSWQK